MIDKELMFEISNYPDLSLFSIIISATSLRDWVELKIDVQFEIILGLLIFLIISSTIVYFFHLLVVIAKSLVKSNLYEIININDLIEIIRFIAIASGLTCLLIHLHLKNYFSWQPCVKKKDIQTLLFFLQLADLGI